MKRVKLKKVRVQPKNLKTCQLIQFRTIVSIDSGFTSWSYSTDDQNPCTSTKIQNSPFSNFLGITTRIPYRSSSKPHFSPFNTSLDKLSFRVWWEGSQWIPRISAHHQSSSRSVLVDHSGQLQRTHCSRTFSSCQGTHCPYKFRRERSWRRLGN